MPIDGALPGVLHGPSEAVGQIARQEVLEGQQITTAITQPRRRSATHIDMPAGYRAMSVMVDQVSGVGTLIKTGDWVDMLIRMDIKPVVINEDGTSATAIDAIDGDTVQAAAPGHAGARHAAAAAAAPRPRAPRRSPARRSPARRSS